LRLRKIIPASPTARLAISAGLFAMGRPANIEMIPGRKPWTAGGLDDHEGDGCADDREGDEMQHGGDGAIEDDEPCAWMDHGRRSCALLLRTMTIGSWEAPPPKNAGTPRGLPRDQAPGCDQRYGRGHPCRSHPT
jgi:hypothetical protein